jgi:putative ABC transport system permease protein
VFRIALKGLAARRWRLLSTGLAILLGVAFISGTSVLGGMLNRSVSSLFDDAYKGIDVVVRSSAAQAAVNSTQPVRAPIDARYLELSRSVNGVRSAQGVIRTLVSMLDKQGKRLSAFGPPVFATNWIDDPVLASGVVTAGRAPTGPDEVAMDFRTANDLGFHLDDVIQVQLPKGATSARLVGIGGLGSDGKKPTPSRILIFDTGFLQQLSGLENKFDYVAVAAAPGTSQQQLADRLGAVVPPDMQAITGQAFLKETQSSLTRIFDNITTFITAFGYIAAFVGAFVIFNTFSILIAQRTRELALLRAVGASRGQLLGSVLVEALLIGTAAALVGLGAGFLVAGGLAKAIGGFLPLGSVAPQLTAGAVIQSFGVGIGVTVLAALIPARRATRIPPVAAMTESAAESRHVSAKRIGFGLLDAVSGLTMVALGARETLNPPIAWIGAGAALVFVALASLGPLFVGRLVALLGRPFDRLLGMTGRLGRENAARSPRRTTATAVALTIGVALVTVITVLAASLKHTVAEGFTEKIDAQVVVDATQGGTGMPPTAADLVRAVPGVRRVGSLRFNSARILNSAKARQLQALPAEVQQQDPEGEGRPLSGPAGEGDQTLLGMNAEQFFAIVNLGRVTPNTAALVDNAAMVSETMMKTNGWKIGDPVELWFATTGPISLPIAATYQQSPFGDSSIIVTVPTFDRTAPEVLRNDFLLYVQTDSGTSPDTVAKHINDAIATVAPTAQAQNIDKFIKEISGQVDTALNFIYVLLALAIIVALVGIWNTLKLTVLERRRELGLLRAVGMERRQVFGSTTWESVLMSALGTIMGLAAGMALGWLLVAGFKDPPVTLAIPTTALAVIAVIGAVAGVITAMVPARSAARTDILQAIATD